MSATLKRQERRWNLAIVQPLPEESPLYQEIMDDFAELQARAIDADAVEMAHGNDFREIPLHELYLSARKGMGCKFLPPERGGYRCSHADSCEGDPCHLFKGAVMMS